jgi:4-azaleucine resistance transporter AzlC
MATAPLALSFVPIGLAFGIAAVEKGLDPVTAILMSALACAGASQFAALELWGDPLPVALIAVTVLVINLRHVLYGAVLYQRLAGMPASARYPLLAVLTDSCFAFAVQVGSQTPTRRDEPGLILGGGLFIYSTWLAATAAGATLGRLIGDTKPYALDVVMVAFFSAILAGLWRGRSDLIPWIAAMLGTLIGLWLLPTGWHVMAGALAGGAAGLMTDDA